jgi:hypothetical protein
LPATRYLKAQKSLHHNALYNPCGLCLLLILPSLKTSLGVDVLLYPMMLLILSSLSLNVLLYPMMLLILPPDLIAEAKETIT